MGMIGGYEGRGYERKRDNDRSNGVMGVVKSKWNEG